MLRVVLSGGPCGGKTTALAKIESELKEKLGITTLIVPETATELMVNGIEPGDIIPNLDFQEFVIRKQLEKEAMYNEIAEKYFNPDKTVILYDRSILDQLAYLDKESFRALLKKYGLDTAKVIERYDVIIHLVTAAIGTDAYTTANNPARKNTAEGAAELDRKTLAGNTVHPHLRVVDNSTNFDKKIQRVLRIVFDSLGEVPPSEIERKYLIRRPSLEDISRLNCSSASSIVQTYLTSADPKVERRIRQRGSEKDGFNLYYTEKRKISGIEREETERRLDASEYLSLLQEADPKLHQITKTRYCFVYESQYFELDLYPFSDRYAILEVEIPSPDTPVKLPHSLGIVRIVEDVTEDDRFKNHSIAKTLSFPELPEL